MESTTLDANGMPCLTPTASLGKYCDVLTGTRGFEVTSENKWLASALVDVRMALSTSLHTARPSLFHFMWSQCRVCSLQRYCHAVHITPRLCSAFRVDLASRSCPRRSFSSACSPAASSTETAGSSIPSSSKSNNNNNNSNGGKQKGSKAPEQRVTPRSEDFSRFTAACT